MTPGLDNGRKIVMSERLQRQTSPDIELGCQACTVPYSALTPGLGMGQDTGLNTEKKTSISEQSEIKTSTVIELVCHATTVRDTAKTPGLGMRQGTPAEATGVGEKQGKVREEKHRLEDKIRKEKRDAMMAEMRKPLVFTQTRKRGRRVEGDWQRRIYLVRLSWVKII
jgi:hypothetical protein